MSSLKAAHPEQTGNFINSCDFSSIYRSVLTDATDKVPRLGSFQSEKFRSGSQGWRNG